MWCEAWNVCRTRDPSASRKHGRMFSLDAIIIPLGRVLPPQPLYSINITKRRHEQHRSVSCRMAQTQTYASQDSTSTSAASCSPTFKWSRSPFSFQRDLSNSCSAIREHSRQYRQCCLGGHSNDYDFCDLGFRRIMRRPPNRPDPKNKA